MPALLPRTDRRVSRRGGSSPTAATLRRRGSICETFSATSDQAINLPLVENTEKSTNGDDAFLTMRRPQVKAVGGWLGEAVMNRRTLLALFGSAAVCGLASPS